MSFAITTNVASAGIVIVLAILYATDDLNNSTVISAALVPSMFATTNEFILYILSVAQVVIAVADVVTAKTSVFPKIELVLYMFGAAISFSPYRPNTIDSTIAFPPGMPPPLPPLAAAFTHIVPLYVKTCPLAGDVIVTSVFVFKETEVRYPCVA